MARRCGLVWWRREGNGKGPGQRWLSGRHIERGGEGRRKPGRRAGDVGGRRPAWLGRRERPEVGDGPDRWAPPVGGCVREREGGKRVGVLDRQTYQGGTRGSRLCGGYRDRLTENSKVCARTRDTRFIQVRAAKVANPTSCLGNQVWRPALGVGLSPERLGMCG
jgi:hypothetical protein